MIAGIDAFEQIRDARGALPVKAVEILEGDDPARLRFRLRGAQEKASAPAVCTLEVLAQVGTAEDKRAAIETLALATGPLFGGGAPESLEAWQLAVNAAQLGMSVHVAVQERDPGLLLQGVGKRLVVDVERGSDSLVLYNRYYGARTRTNDYGRELTVVDGRVTAVGSGNSAIPANGCVVSLHGSAADIYSQVRIGDAVQIDETLGNPWNKAKELVSVGPCLVRNGTVHVTTSEEQLDEIDRHREPRSAIAMTTRGTYLLAVVDGRQANSHGCTLTEWAQLLKSFGATEALNLDGGGSAELVAGGQVLNSPSDGRERGIGSAIVVLKK